MYATMKRIFYLFFAVLLASCNLPDSRSVEAATQPASTPTVVVPLQTNIPDPTSTETSLPSMLTVTPIPCDPSTADYCITDGHFLFQRPILPPDNDTIDLSYAYASTQNGKRDPHHGVEFQNPFGTSVFSAGDGVVVFADADKTTKFSPWRNFYGNVIIIRHAGEMYTLYAHLSAILVQVGAEVKAGDEIGKVGQTGGATGPHLHFEVRKGSDYTDYLSTENPELWLIPPRGTGAISIALMTGEARNYERPLVITRYADGGDEPIFMYYITSYTKGFEHHLEDAVLSNLPPGRYKIAFTHFSGLKERFILVEAGKLTQIVFNLK
ncbi:MAG: hypothetical protein OHK003_12860 [Anaerolineales bacterium]